MPARLSIGRFVAATPPEADGRVAGLARTVVGGELARALDAAEVPAGIWCVRRLDLCVDLDLEDTDAVLGRAWAEALVSGLLAALGGGDPDVVRYDGPVMALADLIGSTAVGRVERTWAWVGAGVRERGDPDPATAPGEAILAAVRRVEGRRAG
ncbi:hypothetical protein, partial [Streptomyces smaragdinus]|uniref:hypothetical protein n=1 Tax=Streptomyces smaragdinus TaxID=2585196 RepID=UPI001E5F200E